MTPMKGAPTCKLCGHAHDLGASHIFDGPKQPLSPPAEHEAPMTEAERKRYDELKSSALVHWAIVGEALTEIRDNRLYREEHPTFEAFCSDVLGFSRQHAYRLIAGAAVAGILSPMGDKEDLTERTVRPLAGLPAEQAREVYKATVDRVGPAPRARDIEATLKPAPVERTLPAVFGSASMTHHDDDPAATADALTPAEEEADQLGEAGQRLADAFAILEPMVPKAALRAPAPPPASVSDIHASLERAGERLADAFEQTQRLGPTERADRRQLNNDLSTLARAVARLQQLLALK
jgi:hypothetical protein